MEIRQISGKLLEETAEWLIKKLREIVESEENPASRDLALRLLYNLVIYRMDDIQLRITDKI